MQRLQQKNKLQPKPAVSYLSICLFLYLCVCLDLFLSRIVIRFFFNSYFFLHTLINPRYPDESCFANAFFKLLMHDKSSLHLVALVFKNTI